MWSLQKLFSRKARSQKNRSRRSQRNRSRRYRMRGGGRIGGGVSARLKYDYPSLAASGIVLDAAVRSKVADLLGKGAAYTHEMLYEDMLVLAESMSFCASAAMDNCLALLHEFTGLTGDMHDSMDQGVFENEGTAPKDHKFLRQLTIIGESVRDGDNTNNAIILALLGAAGTENSLLVKSGAAAVSAVDDIKAIIEALAD